jgi:hypothetical protein
VATEAVYPGTRPALTTSEQNIVDTITAGKRLRARTDTPTPQPRTALDDVLDSLHLMVVSRSYRHQLPGKAVGRALVDGLAAVLVRITLDSDLARSDTADSQNMSILPVTESELLAWNLTPDIVIDLAERKTRIRVQKDTQSATIHGVKTPVVESKLPIAATECCG